MNRYAAATMCFFAGFVVSANLSKLIATNPNYEASYYTVAIATFLAIISAIWDAK